jgi:two-component system chemotaxis response regulator CheB
MGKVDYDPIRVVIVEDSPTARELLTTLFQSAEGMEVIGVAPDGEEGVRLTRELRPDVVTMDVRMPGIDGLEATRRIMHQAPTPIVIVTNSTMRADMDLTFEALRAGALTVMRKPGLADPETCDKVVQAVRLMSEVPVVHHWGRGERAAEETAKPLERDRIVAQPAWKESGKPPSSDTWHLSAEVALWVQRIGIAASTGGPGALAKILGLLPGDYRVPILVVQHITRGFAIGLAEWLDGVTALRVRLAGHGEVPRPGTALLAPDDYHMQVSSAGVVELSKKPPFKGVRPSADYLFRSLAHAYGPRAMGILLTGMGDDGAEGLSVLHDMGGLTIAQDERSCIVYGMPREAVARRAVDRVLTPDQIAQVLGQLAHCQEEKVVADG